MKVLTYDENTDLILGSGLSDEDIDVIKRKVSEHQAEEKPKESTFLLEVMFGKDLSMHGLTTGALSFWRKGVMGGNADTKTYLCPGESCQEPLYEVSMGYDQVPCPHCGKVWPRGEVHGEILAKLPLPKWADLILNYYVRFKMDADLRVKYHSEDIRSAAVQEQGKDLGGEKLNRAREKRAVRIHHMRDIIKDTSAGADLQTVILTRLIA